MYPNHRRLAAKFRAIDQIRDVFVARWAIRPIRVEPLVRDARSI